MTNDLFTVPNSVIPIDMPDADIYLFPSLFPPQTADYLFSTLKNEIPWKQETIKIRGQSHAIPRLTAWHGDPDKIYTYSGLRVEPTPWTKTLRQIKETIEGISGDTFNSVLLNLYRSEADSVAWHSDNEPELGRNPVIGSVSFGETRPFQLKHKKRKGEKHKILLEHGSYLLMKGQTQHRWIHRVPKSQQHMGARINLTFRLIQ